MRRRVNNHPPASGDGVLPTMNRNACPRWFRNHCPQSPEYARLKDELVSIRFLHIPSQYVGYYQDTPHFGESVVSAFPKAATDIQEAAKCFTLGRSTPCVFHLMRVMESATQLF